MAHVVTAPLVIAKNEDGSDLYLYEGAQLPSHVKGDALKALVDSGLVEERKADEPRAASGPSDAQPESDSGKSSRSSK